MYRSRMHNVQKLSLRKLCKVSNADWFAIAIESIDAIECQNWDAYHANKLTIAGYDVQTHYNRIEQRIAPLIALCDAIIQKDNLTVHNSLQQYIHRKYSAFKQHGDPCW